MGLMMKGLGTMGTVVLVNKYRNDAGFRYGVNYFARDSYNKVSLEMQQHILEMKKKWELTKQGGWESLKERAEKGRKSLHDIDIEEETRKAKEELDRVMIENAGNVGEKGDIREMWQDDMTALNRVMFNYVFIMAIAAGDKTPLQSTLNALNLRVQDFYQGQIDESKDKVQAIDAQKVMLKNLQKHTGGLSSQFRMPPQ
ncbi:hypothetical protein [Azospirillum picis]|uniref:Uncharacterized protein n=1 Tax=Azospirillum picis TaxID=488438 RepID=A0ABU0MKB7_9PROT|nr:hypothetical protein [Azospirillum picis]MBP2300265.1 hypothetical protein [Azospirillum picis]MDQ0533893.1 hypothetical protein [Azospirillum picis]